MRLVLLHHPQALSPRIRQIADDVGARNLATLPTAEPRQRLTVLTVESPRLESVAARLEELDDVGLILVPHEVMTAPRGTSPGEHVTKAGLRSPVEIYLRSVSTTGGWPSFTGYAAIAGLLAWSGLFTGTMYLLIAAMLVAPFPDPALNAAIATARGDASLLLRSLYRYFVALAIGVVVAFGLSGAFGVEAAGSLAHDIAALSTAAFLLPLAAGIVGGIYLSESENSSLVTAAAAGVLVTAALSPPVGIVGIALWTGEGLLAVRAAYLLLIQIVGINLAAAAVFRLRGLGVSGPWYRAGRRRVARAAGALTGLALAALMLWQLSSPDMRRGTVGREALSVASEQVRQMAGATLVTGHTAIHGEGQDAVLLATIYGHWQGPPELLNEARNRLRHRIAAALKAKGYPDPLVQIVLLQ